MPERRPHRSGELDPDGAEVRLDRSVGPLIASDRLTAFLTAVDSGLPFAASERREILDELADHLADASAALEVTETEHDAAERAAIEALGDPHSLADELTRARRSPRRLLAAAGAGGWAVVTGGLWGGLVGLAATLLGAVVVEVLVGTLDRVLGTGWSLSVDAGWNSALSLLPLGIAALVAGMRVTPVVASRAGYRARTVRRLLVALGVVALGAYALLGWSGALNWAAVAVLLSLPAWWAAGAWRTSGIRLGSRPRVFAAAALLVLAAVMVPAAFLAVSAPVQTRLSAVGVPVPSPDPHRNNRIGAPTPETIATSASGTGATASEPGTTWVALIVRDPAVLAGWRDLRVEAWPGVAPDSQPWACLSPSATHPYATGPVLSGPPPTIDSFTIPPPDPRAPAARWWPAGSVMLAGPVETGSAPGIDWACVAMTGIASDGVRTIVNGPQLVQTGFNGTAWSWFAALLAGR